MRKTKKWMTSFGSMEDKPADILDFARMQLYALSDEEPASSIALRQVAETIHLALSSAVEIATGKAIDQASNEFKRVRLIAERLNDPTLPKEFNDLRRLLHTEAFHGALHPRPGILVALGAADAMVARILRARRKTHKK